MKIRKYTAEIVDWKYIYIQCPHCVKNSNKFRSTEDVIKGQNFKKVYHIYNTNDNYKNRTMRFRSNCLYSPFGTEIDVVINSKTLRIMK